MRSLVLLLLSVSAAHAAPLDDLATQIGLGADDVKRVRNHEIVQLSRPETSDRDLAVGFVFLCKSSPEQLAKNFRRGVDFASDPTLIAQHAISSIGAAGDFSSLHLAPHGDDEVKRYLAPKNDSINLSDAEENAYRALGPQATLSAVETLLRTSLLARHDAYRKGGLKAVAPYERDKGQERELGEGLRVFSQAPPALQKYASTALSLLRSYPKVPAGTNEAFYWIVYDHDNRPTITLRHRLSMKVDDAVLLVDREFYVSQGYNEMQALAGFIPVGEGTLVFYRADTSTDRVSGASSGLKHSVGRRMMGKQLKAIFEKARGKLDE